MLKFIKNGSDFNRDVLKFMKGNDYSKEVLKIVKISSQGCWDNASAQALYLRGSFSEMFDSLAIITSLGGLRTRAPTPGRNKGL